MDKKNITYITMSIQSSYTSIGRHNLRTIKINTTAIDIESSNDLSLVCVKTQNDLTMWYWIWMDEGKRVNSSQNNDRLF